AEGRMITVGMIYNPVPEERDRWAKPQGRRPSWQARYVAQEQSLVELGIPLRRQGGQVGTDQADRWVALSDGGAGLEAVSKPLVGRHKSLPSNIRHRAGGGFETASYTCTR